MQNSVLKDIWLALDSIKGEIAVLEEKLKLLEEAAEAVSGKAEGDVTYDETSPTAKVEECVTAPEAAPVVATVEEAATVSALDTLGDASPVAPASPAAGEGSSLAQQEPVAEVEPKPKKEPILIIDPSIEYGYATPDPRYLSGEIKVDGDEPAYDPAYDLDLVEPFEPEPLAEPAVEEAAAAPASPAHAPASAAASSSPETWGEGSSLAQQEPVAVETIAEKAEKAEKELDVIDIMDLPPVGGPAVIDLMTAKLAWKTDMPGSPVKNVLSAISLNDRVLFINTLFGEDPVKFSKTIQTFNGYESLAQAEAYIAENYADWNLESDVVYRFMMAVRRKLNK